MDDFAQALVVVAMIALAALPVAMALAAIFGGWV